MMLLTKPQSIPDLERCPNRVPVPKSDFCWRHRLAILTLVELRTEHVLLCAVELIHSAADALPRGCKTRAGLVQTYEKLDRVAVRMDMARAGEQDGAESWQVRN